MKYQLFTYADKNGAAGTGIAVNEQLFSLAGVALGSPIDGKSVMELLADDRYERSELARRLNRRIDK